jgi:rhamnopyranosyl-N-acetylglucosaminyl-diphospho-decaprenol beta-1,3/1,4-galactofuranosyltransferase
MTNWTGESTSVCAAVITYNRPSLLRRSVRALLDQSVPLARILIIDNASDEPAAAALIDFTDPRIQIHRLTANVGAAGGFCFGLKWANVNGCDFTWLLDDDGMAAPNCLECLLDAHKRTGVSLLTPLVLNDENPETLSYGLVVGPKMQREIVLLMSDVIKLVGDDGLIWDTMNPLSGTLMSRSAYHALGDIKAECFIWGEEVEYMQRAAARSVRFATVFAARYYHPPDKSVVLNLHALGSVQFCPPQRSRYYYRNLGFISRTYRSPVHTVAKFLVYFCVLLGRGR